MNSPVLPRHVICHGAVKAAIWENLPGSAERFTVNLWRLFRGGNDWRRSDTFGPGQLLNAAQALTAAHVWVGDVERATHAMGEEPRNSVRLMHSPLVQSRSGSAPEAFSPDVTDSRTPDAPAVPQGAQPIEPHVLTVVSRGLRASKS